MHYACIIPQFFSSAIIPFQLIDRLMKNLSEILVFAMGHWLWWVDEGLYVMCHIGSREVVSGLRMELDSLAIFID